LPALADIAPRARLGERGSIFRGRIFGSGAHDLIRR
jgi:hypothetical protein